MSETDERIQALIHTYIDHLMDAEYVRGIFALADVPTVAAVVLTMLRTAERPMASDADLFVQDVVQFGMYRDFTAYLPQSGIYQALRDLLLTSDHNLRHIAIHTLGRIGPGRNSRFLASAFPTYLERYPTEAPDLLSELFWLSATHRRRRWEYFQRVTDAPHYLVRWSLLETLAHHDRLDVGSPDARSIERLYQQLADDDHFLVAAEAAHALAGFRLSQERDDLPRDELRRRKKALEKTRPGLEFSMFRIGIGNYLHVSGKPDYDLAMLDAFAQYRLHHPPHQGIDLYEDARAFEAWRAQQRRSGTPV